MISVRPMLQEDVDAAARIEQQVFSQPWSRQGFLDALKIQNTVFLIAEEDGRLLGYAGMYCTLEEGEVTNVAVAPQERRRGVGGMLMEAIREEAKRLGLERIILEVRVSNESAIRLYERQGFTKCGTRKGFYDFPKEDAYILICGQ